MVLKRAMKGELDLMGPAMKVASELMSIPEMGDKPEGVLGNEFEALKGFKKAILMVAGSAVQKLMETLAKEQEVLMNLADIMSEIYICESSILATLKAINARGLDACSSQVDMTRVYINDAIERCSFFAKSAVSAWADGDTKRMLMLGIKRYTKHEFINTKSLRRGIADTLLEHNEYCF